MNKVILDECDDALILTIDRGPIKGLQGTDMYYYMNDLYLLFDRYTDMFETDMEIDDIEWN